MEESILDESPFSTIIANYPQYKERFQSLFNLPKSSQFSKKNMNLRIITNPKAIFNLIQSQQLLNLSQTSIHQYIQLKTIVIQSITILLDSFSLNPKMVLNQAYILKQTSKVNFFNYFIGQLYQCIEEESQCAEDNQDKQKYLKLQSFLIKICQSIVSNCRISKDNIQQITKQLTDKFYAQKLNLKLVQTSFRLFSMAAQQRSYYPYLYFLDQLNQGLKILLNNNKWSFNKGITMWAWFKVLKNTDSRILSLKTEDNCQIIIKIVKQTLIVRCQYKQKDIQSSQEQLFKVPLQYINMICIQLQPLNDGIFSSTSYSLKVKLNNVFKTVNIKIPKFSTSQFITEFSWFYHFVGCCYCLMISNKCDINAYDKLQEFPAGICSQQLLIRFLQSDCIKLENIVCILNAQRAYQGLLINNTGQKDQGCYSGGIVNEKNIKKDINHVDALLPYLYFLTLLPITNARDHCFDQVVRKYLEWYLSDKQHRGKQALFILYFLQLSSYAINADTLSYLEISVKESDDLYLKLVIKYMDIVQLVAKNLSLNNDQIQVNPVQKVQLLFYLQSSWKQKWNGLQGFLGWWSPNFFNSQNNDKFCLEQYKYIQKQVKIQWTVRNFITNDYCKCFLQPIFSIPPYADLNGFGQEYRKKQLQSQQFSLILEQPNQRDFIMFQKVARSKFSTFKKLFRKKSQTLVTKQNTIIELKQQFLSKCCLIDLLSNIIGRIRITKKGEIIFSMTHESQQLDHMCIKAFDNTKFIRINFNIKEVKLVRKRRYNQANKTLQFRLYSGQIYLIYFYQGGIDECLQLLEGYVKVRKNPYDYYLKSNKTLDWIEKKISNFQYLMWLNDASGRCYFDITQYPVIPWVSISNQPKLQPKSPHTYRQLVRNMGSFGPEQRTRHFLQKYQSVSQTQIFSEYHFGTHYSSSAIIFNYLIRIHPFSQGALTLQSGKFDCADRVFASYHGSWTNATNSQTDVRQLIPQIYTLPQVMINYNNYDFGFTQDQKRIDNVQLPKWANGNPYIFVMKIRQLLETPIVQQNINHWIDLIFGYKQRGNQALKSMNIFFPLTYEDSIALDSIQDAEQKKSFQTQIAHFGQNPCQIIGSNPHPVRAKNPLAWQGKLLTDPKIDPTVQKFNLSKNYTKQTNEIFNSVFQGKQSILAIKFISQNWFAVIQKHQYCIFHIENKKGNFITKQYQVQYNLQHGGLRIDYPNLPFFVPVTPIQDKIIFVGGFYSGFIQILFITQYKCNQSAKLTTSTITALAYDQKYNYLYVGDSYGRVIVYQVRKEVRYIEFVKIRYLQAHYGRVNCLQVNKYANLVCSCGQDGNVNVYNLYSFQLYRVIKNPTGLPVSLCTLSACPLYSILFYAPQDGKIYSYSLNGQSLDVIQQKSGFLYNFTLVKSSSKMDFLAYVNPLKQLYIVEVPIFKIIRKIKIRKDENKVSCIQCGSNSKIVITGSQDGYLHLVGDKLWF